MAAIDRPDLVTDSAYNLFKDLKVDVVDLNKALDDLRSSGKTFSEALSEGNKSAKELNDTVNGLSADQKALNQVNNQIVAVNAKMTDEYIRQATILKDLQAQQKLKVALGDKEAIQVTALNSSITQLGVALKANQQAYSNLTTQAQRNSAQGQELKKVIDEQYKSYNQLTTAIHNNKENVGNYTESIEKAIPAFKKLNPELVEAGEGFVALGKKAATLLLNPIVLLIAVIVAGLAAIKKGIDNYIEGSVDGADRATVFATKWSTALELINKKLKEIGAGILDLIGFGEDAHLPKWLEMTIAALPGGIKLLSSYYDLLEKNVKINELQNEIKKEEIVLSVESAKLQLEKEEELNAARDKTNRSLQERYEALEKGDQARIAGAKLSQKAALNELELTKEIIGKKGIEINAQTDLNELFKDDLATKKLSYEQFELIAKAQKRLIDAEKEEYEGTRRIQALRNQLVDEQIKFILDGIKQEKDARDKLNVEEITADQERNARILSNQSSTLNEKVEAETKNLLDLKQLNDKSLADELFAFRQNRLDQVILDKETSDEILAEAGNNLKLRAQLILEEKNRILDADATFNSQEFALTEAARLKIEELTKKSGDNIVKITLDTHKRMADAESATSGEQRDAALLALETSFKNREISFLEYERRKKNIEVTGKNDELDIQNDQLRSDLAYLTSTKELEEKFADDILKIRKKLADNEAQIQANSNAKKLEQDKKIYALEKQLANEAFDTIITVSKNQTDGRIQQLDAQLTALQTQHDKEINLAGDNAAAKTQIDKNFADQQAKIQKEQAKLKHDQAVRDKELNEAKILMNTYLAASEALASGPPPGNIIAAALVTALGLLEVTKVASTPIPAYFKGTDNHPGGLAVVGEKGAELMTIPGQGVVLSPAKPTIVDLPAGSEVLPNPETMKQLAMAGLRYSDLASNAMNVDLSGVVGEIKGLRSDMKKQKHRFPNYAKTASGIYEYRQESDTHIKKVLALTGNHR